MGPSAVLPQTGGRARCRVLIEGVVQGVGFRPFVYRLAEAHRLGGSVRNGQHGVLIDVEGDRDAIDRFLDELESTAPSSARLRRITVTWAAPHHDAEPFRIDTSAGEGEAALFPAPDLAVCAACLGEMGDSGNRRYAYPFLDCTECGPRYTIIQTLPYDRERKESAPTNVRPCSMLLGRLSGTIRFNRRTVCPTAECGRPSEGHYPSRLHCCNHADRLYCAAPRPLRRSRWATRGNHAPNARPSEQHSSLALPP
jgi:acylphosphatase